jgi:hypothetical protein
VPAGECTLPAPFASTLREIQSASVQINTRPRDRTEIGGRAGQLNLRGKGLTAKEEGGAAKAQSVRRRMNKRPRGRAKIGAQEEHQDVRKEGLRAEGDRSYNRRRRPAVAVAARLKGEGQQRKGGGAGDEGGRPPPPCSKVRSRIGNRESVGTVRSARAPPGSTRAAAFRSTAAPRSRTHAHALPLRHTLSLAHDTRLPARESSSIPPSTPSPPIYVYWQQPATLRPLPREGVRACGPRASIMRISRLPTLS